MLIIVTGGSSGSGNKRNPLKKPRRSNNSQLQKNKRFQVSVSKVGSSGKRRRKKKKKGKRKCKFCAITAAGLGPTGGLVGTPAPGGTGGGTPGN